MTSLWLRVKEGAGSLEALLDSIVDSLEALSSLDVCSLEVASLDDSSFDELSTLLSSLEEPSLEESGRDDFSLEGILSDELLPPREESWLICSNELEEELSLVVHPPSVNTNAAPNKIQMFFFVINGAPR